MKKIEAIVREEKLDQVKEALEKMGYYGMTLTQVSGRGKQRGIRLQWRAGEYNVDFLPKLKIEVVVMDEDVPQILNVITTISRTGEEGDGKIFLIPIENCVRIRTGEEGVNAV